MYLKKSFQDSVWKMIYDCGLSPVKDYKYSDLGYYLLKQIIETPRTNYTLVPKYLWKKRFGRFFLLSFYTLLVSTWLSFLIVSFVLVYILNKKAFLVPATLHPELQVISLNFIVFLAIAIKQVKRAFYINQEKDQLEKTKLITELKLKEAELKLLKIGETISL